MAMESKGVVHMKGDSTQTIAVEVFTDDETLRPHLRRRGHR